MKLNLNQISNRKLTFRWSDPVHFTFVEVSLPDLSSLNYSVWGDWGSMYTFELDPRQPVRIRYNEKSFECKQSALWINSPMLATERDVYPYFVIIEDIDRHLILHLFLDADHEVGKVQVIRSEDKVSLFESGRRKHIQAVV